MGDLLAQSQERLKDDLPGRCYELNRRAGLGGAIGTAEEECGGKSVLVPVQRRTPALRQAIHGRLEGIAVEIRETGRIDAQSLTRPTSGSSVRWPATAGGGPFYFLVQSMAEKLVPPFHLSPTTSPLGLISNAWLSPPSSAPRSVIVPLDQRNAWVPFCAAFMM